MGWEESIKHQDEFMLGLIEKEKEDKSNLDELVLRVDELCDKVEKLKDKGIYTSRQTVLNSLQKEIENLREIMTL